MEAVARIPSDRNTDLARILKVPTKLGTCQQVHHHRIADVAHRRSRRVAATAVSMVFESSVPPGAEKPVAFAIPFALVDPRHMVPSPNHMRTILLAAELQQQAAGQTPVQRKVDQARTQAPQDIPRFEYVPGRQRGVVHAKATVSPPKTQGPLSGRQGLVGFTMSRPRCRTRRCPIVDPTTIACAHRVTRTMESA